MDNMPPVNPDQEALAREQERSFWTRSLATFGGTAAGAALGGLAMQPVEYLRERKAQREIEAAAMQRADDFARNKEILGVLRDLHHGKLSWDDIEPEVKPGLQEAYEESKSLLSNPAELARNLREKGPATISQLPGAKDFKASRLIPNFGIFKHPGELMSHPIPWTLGLLGAGIAEYAVDKQNEQRLLNVLRGLRPEGGGPHEPV